MYKTTGQAKQVNFNTEVPLRMLSHSVRLSGPNMQKTAKLMDGCSLNFCPSYFENVD